MGFHQPGRDEAPAEIEPAAARGQPRSDRADATIVNSDVYFAVDGIEQGVAENQVHDLPAAC
jgi:hypothetical protein